MRPARLPLILAPTPLHPLPNASKDLNVDLWVKRDDLTGFAMGGNKGRKLEYLIAEAKASGADIIVTSGAMQSNFVRQLGAACSVCGIRCAAVLMALPFEHHPVEGAKTQGGNLILDEILGVEITTHPNGTWGELADLTERKALEFENQGLKVFRVPLGGSSALGAYAFYQAASEVPEFDFIICPCSSGSTFTGLTYAFHGSSTKVIGIACDPEPDMVDDLLPLSKGLDRLTGLSRELTANDFDLRLDYVGPGYGVASDAGTEALEYLARIEGIFLDPIYSAKTFAGLMALAKNKEISGRVLFWHTGGVPAIFAH